MSYVAIDTQLRTILGTVSGLNAIYDHEKKELAKYPAACVTPAEHNNKPGDTAGNKRSYLFLIRLYIRVDEMDDYEATMRALVDDVITKIEANPTLNGACEYTQATNGKWLYQERELPVRVVEITVEANKRVNR